MDSMLNHYTASRKVRNDDAYSPGGQIGRRPDRATAVYCQRAREAYKGVPIIAGGVEASLRRIAHYDYWSDKVRRSVIMDAKPDLLVFGMGGRALTEIVRRLAAHETPAELRDIRGVAYRLGAKEEPPRDEQTVWLPSYEEVAADPQAFARMTRIAHNETNPDNARWLVQAHGPEAVALNPPALPLSEAEMDRVYGLPYTRRPHPSYGRQAIPAWDVIKDSIQIMRGCFGGCTFCSITAHEGRVIQSRSQKSILAEIRRMREDPEFSGVISDLGGPTANMYRMNCRQPDVRAKCRRASCVHPTICKLLDTSHDALLALLRAVRREPGVRKAFVASGIRMDLAQCSPQYMAEMAEHHTGGRLKVAPEHADPEVLALMKKPPIDDFVAFDKKFRAASEAVGKQQQLVPYFIAGHPGCTLDSMIALAEFLKRTGYRPDKVQDFIPNPMDIATCMYHTGLDPLTGKAVYVPRSGHERRLQRALLQFFKPENYDLVREALTQAGRSDLIGGGPKCLIPARPPAHGAGGPRKGERRSAGSGSGYRPHRHWARRREKGK